MCRQPTCLRMLFLFSALSAFSAVNHLHAHPVPKRSHDRVIVVRLTPNEVVVNYDLEVDDWTIVFVDLPAVSDKVDLTKLSKPPDFYKAFGQAYAPILADNLIATLDSQRLEFNWEVRDHQVVDSIRCPFVFRASWKPALGKPHQFVFREGNYETESGLLKLSLETDPAMTVLSRTEPDETLKSKPLIDLKPGDDETLRKAAATFTVNSGVASTGDNTASTDAVKNAGSHFGSLRNLLFDSEQGLVLLLLLAAGFGAAHALTPGHGKTLVAAYLIGEHGTIWHALVLGSVVTLTHTGAVIVLAAILYWFTPKGALDGIETGLEFVGGLLVPGVGFWLLLRRFAGRADHIHRGGSPHHHHHDRGHHHHNDHSHADHYHDEHGHAHPLSTGQERVGWWGLVLLGMSGGIVPCWDAILMLGFAVAAHRLWLALPLLLAFSAGLASVLIVIGILVVYAKGFAASRWGASRWFEALPVVSAVIVTCMGLWLCAASIAPRAPAQTAAAQSR